MKIFVCLGQFEKLRLMLWFSFCFYTGWWLVPSGAYSESRKHRFLPTHEYEGSYKQEERAKYFMWEVEKASEADIKSDYETILDFNKTSGGLREGKVPYLNIEQYVPTQFAKSAELTANYKEFAMKHTSVRPHQKNGVVLLTYYRSGSSFLGQLFNQHPDVFYQFEPLFPYTRDCSAQPAFKKEKVRVLEEVLRCDMPNWHNLFTKMAKRPLLLNDKICIYMGACFRTNSRDLCHSELCPATPTGFQPFTCGRCGPLNLELTDHACRGRKMTAVKTIRICSADWLDDLIKSGKMNLRIIHLIRDPRAVARSRRALEHSGAGHPADGVGSDKHLAANITAMCQLQMKSHQSYAASDNYYQILYEDINRLPLVSAKKVFDFLGLEMAHEVREWIYTNTGKRGGGQSPGGARHRRDLNLADFTLREKIEYEDKEILFYEDGQGHNYTKTRYNLHKQRAMENRPLQEDPNFGFEGVADESPAGGDVAFDPNHIQTRPWEKKPSKSQMYRNLAQKRAVRVNPFGTKRISSNVLEKWPTELPFDLVKDIEAGCAELLDTFGYKLIGSIDDFQDKTKSYLPELEQPNYD